MAAISPGAGFNQTAVTAAQADRFGAKSVESVHDLFVDSPDQDHFHHVHRFRVGHTQTVSEFRRDGQSLQPVIDLWPTAVHNNRLNSDTAEQRQVSEYGGLQFGMGHGCTAVLDHDPAACESLDIRKSLTQNRDPEGIIHSLLLRIHLADPMSTHPLAEAANPVGLHSEV